jgi:hypothetical protein
LIVASVTLPEATSAIPSGVLEFESTTSGTAPAKRTVILRLNGSVAASSAAMSSTSRARSVGG